MTHRQAGRGLDVMTAAKLIRASLVAGTVAVLAAGCGSGGAGSPGTATGGGVPVVSGAPTPAATTPPATAPTVRSPSARPTTVEPTRARNLVASTAVRNQLIAAWVAAQHLNREDVAGTRPGSVYYGYLPATRTYWAVAQFTPSAEAIQHSHSPGGGPIVQFQDGPWVFSQPTGGPWRLVTDSGGVLCPGEVPRALVQVWALASPAVCRTP